MFIFSVLNKILNKNYFNDKNISVPGVLKIDFKDERNNERKPERLRLLESSLYYRGPKRKSP